MAGKGGDNPGSRRRKKAAIIAYPLEDYQPMMTGNVLDEIVAGAPRREWMDETPYRFAYRCIPMTMSNSLGWQLLNPVRCEVVWDGTTTVEALQIRFLDGPASVNPKSHFGSGILTWNAPCIFRTPPGVGMLVTGPANMPKRGITPLEGYVETDWLPNGFSMNWKFTEPDRPVVFERGEPICRIFPYRKNYIEDFQIEVRDVNEDPVFRSKVIQWTTDRALGAKKARSNLDSEAEVKGYWSGNYARGRDTLGNLSKNHKNVFRCKPPVDRRKRR